MTTDVESDDDFVFTDWYHYTDSNCSEGKDSKKFDEKTSHSDKPFDEDMKKDFKFDPKKEIKHKFEPFFGCDYRKDVNEGVEKPDVKRLKQELNKTKKEDKYCVKKEVKNDINSEVKSFLKKCEEIDNKNNDLTNGRPWFEMPFTSKYQPKCEHKVGQSSATPLVRSVQMKDQSTDSRYVMRSTKTIASKEGIPPKSSSNATSHTINQTTAQTTSQINPQTSSHTITHTITQTTAHTITETITEPIAENTPQTTVTSNSLNVKKIWVYVCVNCYKRLKSKKDFIRHHNKRHEKQPKGFIKVEKSDPKYKNASYYAKRKERERRKHHYKSNSLLATDSVPKIKVNLR